MLDNFLKKSWNPLIFRIFATLGFLFALLILYFGSLKLILDFNSNLIMLILWVVWWPFLYITLFFLGRFWCGFICPIGLANEVGNSIRKTRKNLIVKYGWIPFVLFFFIVLWEQISGLFSSSRITLIFLSVFFISAFIIGMLLPRWGFCKSFCPIGTILGVFSRLSIIGVRTNKDICINCKTKECIRGGKVEPCPMFNYVPSLESNKDCLLCTNCIKNCPHNSAKLCFVKPGKEIINKMELNLSESLFIIALLVFEILLTSKGTQIFRIINTNNIWIRAIDFTFGIGLFILIYFFITYVQSKVSKTPLKQNLILGGYVFLPLAFSIMFFLVVFGFITPLTNINESYIAISKYAILSIGTIWSIILARNFFNKKSFVYVLAIILIISLWMFVLIPGPLNLFPDSSKVYLAKSGEVVQMKAFSMGFNPSVIKAKSGGYLDINITNTDIIHTFDIDELGVQINLNGGESKKIRINAIKPGKYEYYCNIPGHREAGMKGWLIIE